jgi:hypothetical protein
VAPLKTSTPRVIRCYCEACRGRADGVGETNGAVFSRAERSNLEEPPLRISSMFFRTACRATLCLSSVTGWPNMRTAVHSSHVPRGVVGWSAPKSPPPPPGQAGTQQPPRSAPRGYQMPLGREGWRTAPHRWRRQGCCRPQTSQSGYPSSSTRAHQRRPEARVVDFDAQNEPCDAFLPRSLRPWRARRWGNVRASHTRPRKDTNPVSAAWRLRGAWPTRSIEGCMAITW